MIRAVELLLMGLLPLVLFYPTYGFLLHLGQRVFPTIDLSLVVRVVCDLWVIVIGKLFLEHIVHYRIAPLVILRLSFSQDEIQAGPLRIAKGAPVAELVMGEVYDYLRFWRLRLTAKELVVFTYRETYKGMLKLADKIKSGGWLLPESTVFMTFSPLLKPQTAERIQAVLPSEGVEPESMEAKRLLSYRVMMFLATGMNSFSRDFPLPKFYRRGYFLARSLMTDELEQFLSQKIARLSVLAERILAEKRSKVVAARLGS